MSDDLIKAYVAERNAALTLMDMAWARKMMPNAAPEVMLAAMHKARYEATGIEPELRRESQAWLQERGLGRIYDLPFPDN